MESKTASSSNSPCDLVRQSCFRLMNDLPTSTALDVPPSNDAKDENNSNNRKKGIRSVGLDINQLSELSNNIVSSVLTKDTKEEEDDDDTAPASWNVADWDADGWHYTAQKYTRPSLSFGKLQEQKWERVALYVLTLDAINFCFWPSNEEEKENPLEYEHLAMALRNLAQSDDHIEDSARSVGDVKNDENDKIVQCESSYAFSPHHLSTLTPAKLTTLLTPHFKTLLSKEQQQHITIPLLNERTRLLNELGTNLIQHHKGSATCMLQKANQSASALVNIVTSTFLGFRDESVDSHGQQCFFYKRGQIVVADLWASVGNCGRLQQQEEDKNNKDKNPCHFKNVHTLTTFADYRIPQLLRHVGALRYDDVLSKTVDDRNEIKAGSNDELYIRAGTVVAVEKLVDLVRNELLSKCDDENIMCEDAKENERMQEKCRILAKDVSAVKLDWYLWQLGEKMDREGTLGPHHRVRTIFY